MTIRKLFLVAGTLLLLAGWAGCGTNTRSAPALSGPAPQAAPPAAPDKGVLQEMGDTTWRVVTAPARMVARKPDTRPAPEHYDPPAAIIIQRNDVEDEPNPTTHP